MKLGLSLGYPMVWAFLALLSFGQHSWAAFFASPLEGLAYNPSAGLLYATSSENGQLLSYDPVLDTVEVIAPSGFATIESLAFDPNTGTLYGSDSSLEQLLTIDTNDGTKLPLGLAGSRTYYGLAFDAFANAFYGVSGNGLFSIDPSTGDSTLIGASGLSLPWSGLTYDRQRRALYGSTFGDAALDIQSQIASIDVSTGRGTVLDDASIPVVNGLASSSSPILPEPSSIWVCASGLIYLLSRRNRSAGSC